MLEKKDCWHLKVTNENRLIASTKSMAVLLHKKRSEFCDAIIDDRYHVPILVLEEITEKQKCTK